MTDDQKGRGLKNLGLFQASDQVKTTGNSVPIDKIVLPIQQPRKYFDSQKQNELVASIKNYGVLEPLIVRSVDGQLELVAGERRLRAAKTAGLLEVPIVLRELSDQAAKEVSLVENLQREGLNPIEETEAILELLMLKLNTPKEETIKYLRHLINNSLDVPSDVSEIFENLSIALSTFVQHRLPLLKLPDDILTAVAEGQIEYSKGVEIGRIKNTDARQAILNETIENDLTRDDVKDRVKKARSDVKDAKAKVNSNEPSKPMKPENDLEKMFGDLCKEIDSIKPWNDPTTKKQIEKVIKIMQGLTKSGSIVKDEE